MRKTLKALLKERGLFGDNGNGKVQKSLKAVIKGNLPFGDLAGNDKVQQILKGNNKGNGKVQRNRGGEVKLISVSADSN